MKSKRLVWLAVVAVLALAGGGAPRSGLAAAGKPHASPCGGPDSAHALVEPPDVEVWNLPTNSEGDHELILSVHTDGTRFCYKYQLNGETQTVAPTIRVHRGERFAVRIVNDIPGPSRAAHLPSAAIPACRPMEMPAMKPVHYVGYLNHTIDDRFVKVPPTDTNLHLHGFQGPADEENVFLSTLSTPVHACEYRITIPSSQPPGTYIYHPHAHGASDVQVAAGLAGVWIVEPDQPQLPRSAEHVLVVRYRLPIAVDNLFAPSGADDAFVADAMAHEVALPIASPVPYDPFNPPPWPATYPMNEGGVASDPSGCNGFDADAQLAIDGSHTPVTLQVPAGQTQLLRVVDATSDTAAPLQMRDASGRNVPLRVAALDGVPVSGDMQRPLSHYLPMNQVMLTSMARADLLVTVEAGSTLTLSKEHFCEGKDGFYQLRHDLVRIAGVSAPGERGVALDSTPVNPADTPAARLVAYARVHPSLVRRRAWTFTEYAFPKNGKRKAHASYFLTQTSNKNFHERPFWPVYGPGATTPSNPDVVVKRGSVEEWYLVNATMESHEFHMHQMAFVSENAGGVPTMGDTAFVAVGSLLPNKRDPNYPLIKPRITKILLDFRNVPRGTFVFHCHMLFHEDRGMMAIVRVE